MSNFQINENELEALLAEFEGRYADKNKAMCDIVRKMLQVSESKRPTFTELKKEYCDDVQLRDKAENAYEYEVVENPFKHQMEQRRRQIE